MSTLDHPPKEKAAPRRGTGQAANGNQERPQSIASSPAGKLHFDPATLDALRSRLPEYLAKIGVELRKNGSRLVGKCPVHADTDPSFAVFGDGHQTCGCHPCGHTGDVFATSQWLGRASTFPEAVADVAAVLGVHLPDSTAGPATAPATPQKRPAKVEVPFELSPGDREKVDEAKFNWSDAFHSGDTIIDRIAENLGLTRETLRYAGHGASGLGIASGWLVYIYPSGLKWRNPDSNAKPRFAWLLSLIHI